MPSSDHLVMNDLRPISSASVGVTLSGATVVGVNVGQLIYFRGSGSTVNAYPIIEEVLHRSEEEIAKIRHCGVGCAMNLHDRKGAGRLTGSQICYRHGTGN